MKRFVGFVLAAAALVAFVCFKTYSITIFGEKAEYSLLDLVKQNDYFKNLCDAIIEGFKSGDKDSILNVVVFLVGNVGLALSLLFAGLSKKFGRFFWGLITVAICVAYALIINGKILPEYSLFSILLGYVPYIGYYIAGGAGLVLLVMPFVWRD